MKHFVILTLCGLVLTTTMSMCSSESDNPTPKPKPTDTLPIPTDTIPNPTDTITPPVIDLDTCKLSSNSLTISADTTTITFVVTTNRVFSVTSDAEWLSVVSDGRATNDYQVVVNASENSEYVSRVGKLTVTFSTSPQVQTLYFTVTQAAAVPSAPDGKKIYKPNGFAKFENESSQYSYYRMDYTDNLVLFWEKGFGSDLSKAPNLDGKSMKVNQSNLMKRTEEIYEYYRDVLKFVKPGSKSEQYRMMLMLNYNNEGTVYGGGYDNVIGALWLSPNRIQDTKLNAVAHELGHSFQFQVYDDDNSTGYGSGGIFEMTSQWMLWQVNPDWMTDENYHWTAFMDQTHYAFMHNDNMYHSPYVLEYWSDKHGIEFNGDMWRAAKRRSDPVLVYKEMTGLTQDEFCDEMCEAAQKFMTYDFDRIRSNAAKYANKHKCTLDTLSEWGDNVYRIDESRVPQNYGYNGISLKIPEVGTTVKVEFTGLVDQISNRTNKSRAGWRYAFVGVPASGDVIYSPIESDHEEGSLSFTVPSDAKLKYLWLVVVGAPTVHNSYRPEVTYVYPYQIKLEGTSPRTPACTLKRFSE